MQILRISLSTTNVIILEWSFLSRCLLFRKIARKSHFVAYLSIGERRHVAAQLVQFVVQTIYLAVLVLLSATRLQKENVLAYKGSCFVYWLVCVRVDESRCDDA